MSGLFISAMGYGINQILYKNDPNFLEALLVF